MHSKFSQVRPRPIVELQIGVDQADLLYSLEDVWGRADEPIAGLSPMGWTCSGIAEVPAERTKTNIKLVLIATYELSSLVGRY